MSGGAAVYADVLVVGAGPTGLTAACELLLLELLHRLGGRVERPSWRLFVDLVSTGSR